MQQGCGQWTGGLGADPGIRLPVMQLLLCEHHSSGIDGKRGQPPRLTGGKVRGGVFLMVGGHRPEPILEQGMGLQAHTRL